MKKRNVWIIGAMVGCVFLGSFINESRHQVKKITPQSSSMIAMYIQDEEGNYNLSDAQEFPKDGYVLNSEKSSCKNGGVISQNASTKALSLKVKTSDECTVYFDVVKGTKGTELLLSKTNDASITSYTSGNKKEMFVFNHPEVNQTTGWTDEERRDYRYIGSEPNNYIIFNDETWRIIGVFTAETERNNKEKLIKIIRNESIGDIAWDLNESDEWSTASLQTLLNESYYNQTGDYISTSSIKGLNEIARKQVETVKFFGSRFPPSGDASTIYGYERSYTALQNIGLLFFK